MRSGTQSGIVEILKDRAVDGCLLYDGFIVLLAGTLTLSVLLSAGALVLN